MTPLAKYSVFEKDLALEFVPAKGFKRVYLAADVDPRLAALVGALSNCFMLARRMLAKSKPTDSEWEHVHRLCKEAGCEEGGVLREQPKAALAVTTETP